MKNQLIVTLFLGGFIGLTGCATVNTNTINPFNSSIVHKVSVTEAITTEATTTEATTIGMIIPNVNTAPNVQVSHNSTDLMVNTFNQDVKAFGTSIQSNTTNVVIMHHHGDYNHTRRSYSNYEL